MSTYEKGGDEFWCEMMLRDKKGKPIDPVGFCGFCDKNDKVWYIPYRKCHAKQQNNVNSYEK